MEIPRKIEKLLQKRQSLSTQLSAVEDELDKWLVENGANLHDDDLTDGVLSSVLIYCEPWAANDVVREFIQNRL